LTAIEPQSEQAKAFMALAEAVKAKLERLPTSATHSAAMNPPTK